MSHSTPTETQGPTLEAVAATARRFETALASVVLGKPVQVRLATAALLSGQHLLLNDLPGVGKTTLGSTLAKTISGAFGRVQGTPDLLPSDLTGVSIYSQKTEEWSFRPGPLFSNVVLVDELNRITPRTQSALLEAMAEGHVTVDGESRWVPSPFLVVATMNPAGSAGTFPLTSAQLDRFGITLSIGRPDRQIQKQLLRGVGGVRASSELQAIMDPETLVSLRSHIQYVQISDPVLDYALDVCESLEPVGHLSARAPQALLDLARVLAVLSERPYVVPDDIKHLAVPVLAHRLSREGEAVDVRAQEVASALDNVPVPTPTG